MLPETMTAVEIAEPGGPEVLRAVERPVPEPKPADGAVLIPRPRPEETPHGLDGPVRSSSVRLHVVAAVEVGRAPTQSARCRAD